MVKQTLTAYFYGLFLLSILACSNQAAEDEAGGYTLPEGYKPFSYTRVQLSKSAGDCMQEVPRCASISFAYPQFSDGPSPAMVDRLNAYLMSKMQVLYEEEEEQARPLEEVMQEFIDDFESFNADYEEEFRIQWTLERDADVLYQSPRLLSLSISEYSDMGGAHGQGYIGYHVFDIIEERWLALEDLFEEDSMEGVTSMGEYYFRMSKGMMEGESLEEAGFWFDDNQFYLSRNFAISGNDLLFYYNNYEIAPYSTGPTELSIPLLDLSIWLKEAYQPDRNLDM